MKKDTERIIAKIQSMQLEGSNAPDYADDIFVMTLKAKLYEELKKEKRDVPYVSSLLKAVRKLTN